MPEGELPPIRGQLITDSGDKGPPQNIHDLAPLTPQEKAQWRSHIRTELRKLGSPLTNFMRATSWTTKVFSYTLNLASDFVPIPTYGTSFIGFAGFVDAKEKQAKEEARIEAVNAEAGEIDDED